MKIVVVIPTYNEGENIGRIIDLLLEERRFMPEHELKVLVVDGNSGDDTAEIVRKKAERNQGINLIVEQKKSGLGGAYVLGFNYAMRELGAEAIVEMDGDFQHDPRDVKRLAAKLAEGFDYVLGSRYVRGGSIPRSWAFHRKLLSLCGNIFARLALGLFGVRDVTSGFRILRVSAISKIDLGKLEKKTYAYKIQLLYEVKRAGGKISEVPIKFGLRDRGNSKMEKENILGSLRLISKLWARDSQSFIR
ncbi:polyprenol monophosphomannose synthase, partial [candidate division WWE3 bacterium]|nr:polyprenol monophosphomannose synthase [candidate division WWE3 bacterium]